MDTSRPQHPIRTFRLVHVSSSLNDTAGTYDGKTDHRRMAAGDRLVARVREEDKTVNEGNHIPAHRATPHSFAGRDNYRCILLQMSWIIFLYPVLLFPLAILGGRRYNSDLKKARVEADTQTSTVIGKDPLLQVLKKIDMMGLADIDRLKSGRGGRRLASLPSITERIDNLQGLSSLASFSSI